MSNLKPCPFCGGEAELCYGPGLGTDSCRGYTLYASCNECCAKSPGLWQENKPEPNDQSWKDAADEWNHRPGEPDLENRGVACCEHYPEGLPVCSRCREERTIARDKACAELVEARAEIENLQWHVSEEQAKTMAVLELNDRALELVNEARARIDHLERIIDEMTEEQASLCAEGQSITELVAAKDKLIEQMKAEIERLKRCCNCEYANHKLEICEHPDNEPETFMDGVCDLWSHNI